MILSTPQVSTRLFQYSAKDRTLTADASMLQGFRLSRVYDDACDVGFTLVSHKTGVEVPLALQHTESRDGDTLWDDFIPANPRQRHLFTRVRVFND